MTRRDFCASDVASPKTKLTLPGVGGSREQDIIVTLWKENHGLQGWICLTRSA